MAIEVTAAIDLWRARVERLEEQAVSLHERIAAATARTERAEAAIQRVRELLGDWCAMDPYAEISLVADQLVTRNARDAAASEYPLYITDRGLAVWFEGEDTYGDWLMVQDSSAAEYPAVWIFGKDNRNHLDEDRAAALRDALTAWLAEIGHESV